MPVFRFLTTFVLLALLLALLLFAGLEGICLYAVAKLAPEPVSEQLHSPPEAMEVLWVALGESGAITRYQYSVPGYLGVLIASAQNMPAGLRSSFSVARYQLGANKRRVLGWHPDNLLVASWHSHHSRALPMLQYMLDNDDYGYRQYGVEEAARFYFGKSEAALSLSEWVTLIAMAKQPGVFSPWSDPARLKKRGAWLFEQLQKNWPEKYGKAVYRYPEFSGMKTP